MKRALSLVIALGALAVVVATSACATPCCYCEASSSGFALPLEANAANTRVEQQPVVVAASVDGVTY